MNTRTIPRELEDALAEVPVLDVHSHLVGGNLAARGLHDVLLYHMVVTELYAAGCPSGARLSQYPGWATPEEATARIEEALPFLSHIQNTSTFWGVRIILRDLHGWNDAITPGNWRTLDALIRERADDHAWQRSILDRAGIRRTATEFARRGDGSDDDRLQYVLEWAMFCRCQWGEFDTAVYELERTWGRPPESPTPIGEGSRTPTPRTIRSVADVKAAIQHYVSAIPDHLLATAATFSSDIDYRPASDAAMDAALSRRAHAGVAERDIYASYINEAFLSELERVKGDRIVCQFALGAEPLPFETGCRLPQRTLAQLAEIIARHPRLKFQCLLASRHGNQSLCTLARELPNFSLVGYWWHNFFPDSIRQLMRERFDMVPANKQVGFFSDAYCVEWAYAKAMIVRKQMARVLAEKIEQGQYTRDEALAFARRILYDSPQSLLGMQPHTPGP